MSGSIFELGDTTVTFRVEDVDGLSAACSFVIRLSPPVELLAEPDTEAPTITCPGNPQGPGLPHLLAYETPSDFDGSSVRVTYPMPSSADNRPGAVLEQLEGGPPGSLFSAGDTLLVSDLTLSHCTARTKGACLTPSHSPNPSTSAHAQQSVPRPSPSTTIELQREP